MRIQSLLWLMPFLLFLCGYYGAYRLFVNEICNVPSVIGKSTYEAVTILSQLQLQTRIVAEREDNGLAEGTVISQNPVQGQTIKAQQVVFLVVSKKSPAIRAPLFVDRLEDEVMQLAYKYDIAIKKIHIPHPAILGKCIAQVPEPGEEVLLSGCIVYISLGMPAMYIMPNCVGMAVGTVKEFFNARDIHVQVYNHQKAIDYDYSDEIIVDQRPFAGSCINLKKVSTVQLSIAPCN